MRDDRLALFLVCAVAFALRLALYGVFPSLVHPDETFQYIEPAHRIVYGSGVLSWEYQLGLRSWLLPGVLAGVIEISRMFGDMPWVRSWAIVVAMSLLSTIPIVTGFLWGRRWYGLPGAILVGGFSAIWFQTIYFGAHVLADTVAAACLSGALWLGDPTARPIGARRLFWAGVAFGVTAVVRIQLCPALGLAALALCRLEVRARWRPFLAGALVPVLLFGLLDWITFGTWFHSLRMYVWVNMTLDIASSFGVLPWYSYPGWMILDWVWATPFILLAVALGARILPVPCAVAIVIVLSYSVIAHKERRFVYPALPLLVTLAGLGTARLLQPLLRDHRKAIISVSAALAAWGSLSGVLASRAWFVEDLVLGTGVVALTHALAADPSVCGMAALPLGENWSATGGWATGGYSHMRPGMMLYQANPSEAVAQADAFNAILAPAQLRLHDPRYARVECRANGPSDYPWREVCIWRRAGACDPASAVPIDRPHDPVMDLIPK